MFVNLQVFGFFGVPSNQYAGFGWVGGPRFHGKSSALQAGCVVAVLCVATAIASPAQVFTTLVSFNGSNGGGPSSSLIQGTDGNFYGTTGSNGGSCSPYGCGTVFKITANGTLTTVYSFCSQPGCADGIEPGGLVQAPDGNFYGITRYGGNNNSNCIGGGCGTAFKLTPNGALTTLYNFCSQAGCADGEYPNGPLALAPDGTLYGTTFGGGVNDWGTVFKMTPNGALTTLYSFCSQTQCFDGSFPGNGLAQGADGNFYGTTFEGGGLGGGTVFTITPSGTLTSLYDFLAGLGFVEGVLVQASDGTFYGTTSGGGEGYGTVFNVTGPGGTLTTLYSFVNGTDGAFPAAGLVQATDGNFYGTTGGGRNCSPSCGTLFTITASGALTTLHTFTGTDGASPQAALVQGTDGNFYGTSYQGGTSNNCTGGCGTVFSLSVGLAPFVEIQPTSGKVGTPVTILGTNLTGASSVTFNGTPAKFQIVSPSEITTTVPAGATIGPVQVTTPGGALTSNAEFWVSAPLQFVPVTECRVLDTRIKYGGGGPLQGGMTYMLNLPQLSQAANCPDLSPAVAYSLNFTVQPGGLSLGYLTTWPTGEVQPFVSTLNSVDGRVKGNAAIVAAGTNGAINVYLPETTDLVLDVNGYFAPASGSSLAFYALPPCRVADTRNPNGDLGGPYLTGGVPRDFPILEASSCNIPNTAQAYSLNFTAVPHGYLGYLTVWPTGQAQPLVSTLNAYTGTVTANAVIVAAGTEGEISSYATMDTDLVIDINGYFAPPGQGSALSLYMVMPCRVLDTRYSSTGAFNGTLPVNAIVSSCAVPPAAAYLLNATVVPTGPLGYLTLWAYEEPQPFVSTLNAYDGVVSSNMAIVPAGFQSIIDTYVNGVPTYLVLDFYGYFAP